MIAMKAEVLTACDQIVAATANGVYQGIILTVLVGFVLRLLGRTNAATRHSIWFVALLLVLGLIPAHHWLDSRDLAPQPTGARNLAGLETGNAAAAPPASLSTLEPGSGSTAETELRRRPADGLGDPREMLAKTEERESRVPFPPVPWDDRIDSGHPTPSRAGLASWPSSSNEAVMRRDPARSAAAADRIFNGLRWGLSRIAEPISWNLASRFNLPGLASLVLLATLLIVTGFKLAVLSWRLCQVQQLKRNSLPASQELGGLFRDLRAQLRLKRGVELRVCATHRSPLVLGFVHPVILLPSPGPFSGDIGQTEHILRHELAHVWRRDDWTNLFQHCIQAILFFHPAVWWLSRKLALEREIACDDHVLEQGGRPRAYALILATLASQMRKWPLLLAPGASTNKSQLKQRINMILDTNRNTSPCLAKTRLGFITSAAALLAVLSIYAGPRLVLAQTPTPSVAAKAPPGVSATGPTWAGGASAAALPTPPAPATISVAQADAPATPAPAEEESGPKYKPETPGEHAPQPVIVVPPSTPTPPMVVVTPNPAAAPLVVGAPHPMALPPAPAIPTAPYALMALGESGGSIEDRLERLERMVNELMAQRNPKHAHGAGMAGAKPQPGVTVDQKEIARMKERAEREAAREDQQAKRAAEEAKRATKDFEKARKEMGDWSIGQHKEASQRQLEALRRAREGLERQMERLDAQIEKLEKEREKLDEEQQRRSELQEDQAKEQDALAEDAAE